VSGAVYFQSRATDATVLLSGESGTGKELARGPSIRTASADNLSWRLTAQRWQNRCLRANYSGAREGAFTGALVQKKEGSKLPTAAQCFLMRLANSHPTPGEAAARFGRA